MTPCRLAINYRVSDLAESIFRAVLKMKTATSAEKSVINYQFTRLDASDD
jgi:tRNA threonylcarbamoyladenosine modification (KEOPS) complex  Pcc1 subunit